MKRASCRGYPPNIFFPGDPNGKNFHDKRGLTRTKAAFALTICERCPVRAECLTYALKHYDDKYMPTDDGVWGGTVPWERKLLLQSRAI
jgi:WhiB family redox-sensing transcriptional regulator